VSATLSHTVMDTAHASSRRQIPGVLRHLHRLTHSFVHDGQRISYIRIYARPPSSDDTRQLEFIVAQDSGLEGIACVDDTARAATLGFQVYQQTASAEALRLARDWLSFVEYMQGPDGRFANFILDEAGTKNLRGQTSRTGGTWWTARAMWALATAWRVTQDPHYLRCFERGRLSPTADMKIKALHALALMELYQVQPSTALLTRICALCDAIVARGHGYFRDRADKANVKMWGYHQLQAVARAGRLFSRPDYVAACEATVQNLVEPVIAAGFYHDYPREQDHQCAYDISPLVLGLEELYRVRGQPRLRELALECAGWLDGHNLAGTAMYDPRTGCCSDGITGGEASLDCGAESAIEAGFIEFARRRLRSTTGKRRALAGVTMPALLT
jgi:hypothetical protein